MKRFVIGLAELMVLAVLSYGLFLLCAELYTRHNGFPASWHPDEPGKASQLRRDNRNYNHPQLLLEATIWLGEREKMPDSTQAIVETGRRASAYMGAAGAVLLAWAGYFSAGRIGFLLAAAGAGLCPAVLCHAHYMKEDVSLCFGVAAVICVGSAMMWRWHWALMLVWAALLGTACGVAASGKYVGAVMIVPALLLSIAVGWKRWWILPLLPLIVAGTAVESWKSINHRAIKNWSDFRSGFETEAAHAIEGHNNVKIPTPNSYFTRLAWTEAMPHVKVLAVATPLAMLVVRRRRRRVPPPQPQPKPTLPGRTISAAEALRMLFWHPMVGPRHSAWFFAWLATCIMAFCLLLSQNTIPFYRYALPVTWMLYTFAAVGAAWLARAMETRFTPAWLMGLGLLAVVAILQYERCEDYLAQFATDCRYKLRHWVNTLPRGSRIVADGYTQLEGSSGGLFERFGGRIEVNRHFFASHADSIENLTARRIHYVVIAGTNYERFLDPATTWADDPGRFAADRRFYQTLFAKYPVVARWTAEHPMRAFANPDVYVFMLNEPGNSRRRRP